jgi:hypothetical protein
MRREARQAGNEVEFAVRDFARQKRQAHRRVQHRPKHGFARAAASERDNLGVQPGGRDAARQMDGDAIGASLTEAVHG